MKKLLVMFVIFALLATPAFAAYETSSWTTETTYKDKTLAKFGFGLKNTLLGWTEIFTEPYDAKKAGKCCITGFGKGLYHGITDTILGVVHLVTFPVPVDIKLPEGGVYPKK